MTQQPLISHRVLIHAWPGHSDAVGVAVAQLAKVTRPLHGCVAIGATRLAESANGWQLDLCWADSTAMAAWLAEPVADLFTRLVSEHAIRCVDFQPGASEAVELRRAG